MFASKLIPRQDKEKFSWQVIKRLGEENGIKDSVTIKENIDKYGRIFGK